MVSDEEEKEEEEEEEEEEEADERERGIAVTITMVQTWVSSISKVTFELLHTMFEFVHFQHS